MKYCLDANIFITSWRDRYPIDIFPGLWANLAVQRGNIILIKPIHDEIEPISHADKKEMTDAQLDAKYPVKRWLTKNNFEPTPVDDNVEALSIQMEHKYQTMPESKGASQNDIRMMAFAKVHQHTVVTFEAEQPNKPGKKSNYKIPLICTEQNIPCIKFTDMLKVMDISI